MTADLLRLLEESRQELYDAVAGLGEGQAAEAPGTGGWSALECVEHLAIVEERARQRLAGAARGESGTESRIEFLSRAVEGRERRVEAPAPVVPAGRFRTLAEALAAFGRERDATLATVAGLAADLSYLTSRHPVLGILNGEEMVAVLAAHTRRHAAQVREMRGQASPDA